MKRTIFLTRILSLICITAVTCSTGAMAAVLHPDVSRVTYHDFGQNCGRYSVQNVNNLLTHLSTNKVEGITSSGGVHISYTTGQAYWQMPQEMIDYHGISQTGNVTAINPAFVVTVEHNPTLDAEFTSRYIGLNNCINYYSIEHDQSNLYELDPGHDYKIMRTSKLITDVDYYTVHRGNITKDTMLFRAGAGSTFQADHSGKNVSISGALTTGGIFYANAGISDKLINFFPPDWKKVDPSTGSPLPMEPRKGDSGSPVFVWNAETGKYDYVSSVWALRYYPASGKTDTSTSWARQWTYDTMEKYNSRVDMQNASTNEIRLGIINKEGTTHVDNLGNSGTIYTGTVTNASGKEMKEIGTMYGVQSGLHTWGSLTALKDNNTWYNYKDNYLNATQDGTKYADLMQTKNLVFDAAGQDSYTIEVDADIDLGIGYLEFGKGDQSHVDYTLTSTAGKQIDSAGYVVGDGVDLYINFTNKDSAYMREWRKIGEGNLHLTGSGNNEIFLNVGGKGATYLEADGGYAAYNVLANNGATVVIKDVGQIKRDFTFGAGGGTLDMNGNSMDWYSSTGADTAGFSIQAHTQDAIITNTNDSEGSTLTYKQSGNQTFKGSFRDTATASLNIVYDGSGTWTLNSIHTNLSNENSGFTVKSGTAVLVGTNTYHAPGSLASGGSYSDKDDWHYADSKMNVTVEGGTFKLGSHARLDGDVTVKSGGNYIMAEGVKYRYEFIEGWYEKEDTYAIADFYGHKGDVKLESGASMTVQYSDGVTANTTYSGNITGAGNVTIDTGTLGGTVTFAGQNDFSGTKKIESGGLLAKNNAALGNVTDGGKWIIGEKGFLSSAEFTADKAGNILSFIDGSSNGAVALQGTGTFTQLNLDNHTDLIIGAMEGHTVQYGDAGTSESLKSYNGAWNLGGGGGTLVVNYALADGSILNLGNAYTHGTVKLTNENNKISQINFNGAVTLGFDNEKALGAAKLNLNYGVRVFSSSDVVSMLSSTITADAVGVLLVDNIENKSTTIDLTARPGVTIGSNGNVTYDGKIKVNTNGTYYLGGSTGTLKLTQSLEKNGTNNLVVDGQAYSGGTIQLGAKSDITGTVTVQGYDSDKLATLNRQPTGNESIVLSFTTDNVLSSAAKVVVQNKGAIDLNGTSQTFNNLNVAAGHVVYDSVKGKDNALTLNYDNNFTFVGTVDVGKLIKTGAGQLVINGHLEYDSFTVSGGSVLLNTNDALSTTGIVYVAGGTVSVKKSASFLDPDPVSTGANFVISAGGKVDLYANSPVYQSDYSGSVTFEGGGSLKLAGANVKGNITFNSSDATTGGTVYMGTTTTEGQGSPTPKAVAISGNITVFSGTGSLDTMATNNSSHIVDVTGDVAISNGATLALKQSAARTTYRLYAASINNDVSTDSDGNVLAPGTIDVHAATLSLNGSNQTVGGTVQLRNGVTLGGSGGTKTLDNLTIYEGATAKMNGGATWRIHSLNGTGNKLNLEGGGTIILDGAGDFSGTVTKNTGKLELAHADAVKNARVEIWGATPLAINADNVNMVSLSSATDNTTATLLAGAAGATTSTRHATLTITGSETATFVGSVLGDADNGLSLVMAGSGTQTFSGAVAVHDLTVKSGTLALTGTTTTHGDICIGQGATLNLTSGYTLGTGKTLSVAAGTGSATLQGGPLTIAGGTLHVDSNILQSDTPVLTLNQSVVADQNAKLTISLGSLSNVVFGTAYTISSGNWSALEVSNISTFGLQYMEQTFATSAEGLTVTFTQLDGTQVWNGTEQEHTWSDTAFGQDKSLPTTIAIFNDTAAYKNVDLSASPGVEKIYFDNSQGNDYTLTGEYLTTVSEISKDGAGKVTIDADIQNSNINLYDGSLELGKAAELTSVNAYGDALIINQSTITTSTLNVSQEATLTVQGGQLVIDGSNMTTGTGTVLLSGVNVQNSTNTAISGMLKIADATTWNAEANGVTVSESAELLMSHDSSLTRTDVGDTVINGTLGIDAGTSDAKSEATFTSEGRILLNTGSIKVSDNAHLTLDARVAKDESATGSIKVGNNAKLSINREVSMGTGTVDLTADGAQLWLNAAASVGTVNLNGKSTIGSTTDGVANIGTLSMALSSTTEFDGVTVNVANGQAFDSRRFASNSTSHSNTIALLNGATLNDRGSYYAVTGSLNVLGDENGVGTMYINGIRLSDGNVQSTLTVGTNTHMVITGSETGQKGSFALSHWGSALRSQNKNNNINLYGTLTSNAILSTWDNHANVNVYAGGELNLLKGLERSTAYNYGRATVNVMAGATLNAKGGVNNNMLVVNLASGATLGAIADTAGGTATYTNAMNIGTAGSAEAVTFNTDVKTVNADTYMLNDNVGKGGNVVLSGVSRIGASAVKVTGAGQLWLADGVETASATPKGISLASNDNGKNAAELSGLATFTRSDNVVTLAGTGIDNKAIISNALIDVMENCKLVLTHVELADTTRITDDAATLSLVDVVAHVTVGTNAELVAKDEVLTISSTLMDTVTVEGNFTIELSGLSDELLAKYEYVDIVFADESGHNKVTFAEGLTIQAVCVDGGSSVIGELVVDQDAATARSVRFSASALAVPEPTTATLSLLALAALAARRRRR